MKTNLPVYILVKARDWAKTSFRHPWQKVFASHLTNYTLHKYGDTRKNSYQSLRRTLVKELNNSAEPACLIVDLNKATPAELSEFLINSPKDNISLTLSSSTGSKLASTLTKKLLFGFNTPTYSAIKLLPHLVNFNLHESDLSLRSDHSLLGLAKTLSLEPLYIGVRPSKLSEFAHVIAKKVSQLFSPSRPAHIPSNSKENMIGAGMIHKGQTFITHTTLRERASATNSFSQKQILFLISLVTLFVIGLFVNPISTMIVFTATLSSIYFIDVLFNLYLVSKSIHTPPELEFSPEEVNSLEDKDLPIYTILVPLYKEANVLPHFLESMENMNYPKSKLDVMLLLEEDDKETIQVSKELNLPKYVRAVVVPHSMPKTKPKACNYGLSMAKGEYVVIYDAEDQPDPDQLKKAILGFRSSPANVGCLQAKLNYHNKDQNLLTRFFTAEYSLWFDVVLPGLQSINTSIPLGGTSNHFRVKDLITFQGWDAFNVTEDADLGSRLFKAGYKTAIINSVTLEEANSKVGNWVRQRSRWIKGYMQTFLVHNRNFRKFFKEQGIHALVFQLTVGGKIAFMLINPLLWIATISYFLLYAYVGPTIESFYPTYVFYMAAFSLVFGNFLFIYYYMIGVAKHGHWSLVKYIYLVPVYWLLISRAALKALNQLFFNPHYWEKTIHGLHLKSKNNPPQKLPTEQSTVRSRVFFSNIQNFYKKELSGGITLVIAAVFANIFNFLYNAYLSRNVSFDLIGLISLVSSFVYFSEVPLGALSKTLTYKSGILYGKTNAFPKMFWSKARKGIAIFSLVFTALWLVLTPGLARFFHSDSLLPFYLFSPAWVILSLNAVDRGFLSGVQKFNITALMLLTEAVSRFLVVYLLVSIGLVDYIYSSVTISSLIALSVGWLSINLLKGDLKTADETKFPIKFYITSFVLGISSLVFLSLDVVLAKHYLSPVDAGKYALVSLVGKMVYFIGNLFGQFITPVVSKKVGSNENARQIFVVLLFTSVFSSFITAVMFGVYGYIFLPILFGQKILDILQYLPLYCISFVIYTAASNLANYKQIKRNYLLTWVSLACSIMLAVGFHHFHGNITNLINVMFSVSLFYLSISILVTKFDKQITTISNNLLDLVGLFSDIKKSNETVGHMSKVLIFNWRDTKHVWAGGAEQYVQKLGESWTKNGIRVTIFCGNDGKHPRNEVINGVQIIRRGGFFTVYLWAFLYYIFRLRKYFDVIVDSQNGIPFFTPLYVRKPVYLLIHHIHQNVFREHLPSPIAQIAMFAESVVMPLVYRNCNIITVSESSKSDIQKLKITPKKNIEIVSPGIHLPKIKNLPKKTIYPSFCYIGRLKSYKNIDLAIRVFKNVVAENKNAILYIAGSGEMDSQLRKLTKDLGLESNIKYLGRITDVKKVRLMSMCWAMIQPSSFEGWGITVIESNACGTPVIASNVAGLRDSVIDQKTGILFEKNNESSLLDAMNKIISDSRMRHKISSAARLHSTKYTWSKSSSDFYNIIIGQRNLSNDIDNKNLLFQLNISNTQNEN